MKYGAASVIVNYKVLMVFIIIIIIIIIVISKKKFKHISIKIPFPCLYASGIQIKIYL